MVTITRSAAPILCCLAVLLAGCPDPGPEPEPDPTPAGPVDADQDGFPEDLDCDDEDATTYPGADELCDEVDHDCDGETDPPDGVGDTWYIDHDGDGWGSDDYVLVTCNPPDGWVADLGDCDDTDEHVHPDADEVCNDIDDDCDGLVDDDDDDLSDVPVWEIDADGDGFADPDNTVQSCDPPDGGLTPGGPADCDDGDADIHPGADEVCDEADNDCDGLVDDDDPDVTGGDLFELDLDGDGFGDPVLVFEACEAPLLTVPAGGDLDCDDSDALVNPDATEICNDIDDDCDGLVDDDDDPVDGQSEWAADLDGDGFGDADDLILACDQPDDTVPVGGPEDCDDTEASTYPGAEESWFDGVDSDCDGLDDPDACDLEPPASTVAVDPACTYTPPEGTFNPTVEWAMNSFSTFAGWGHSYSAPVVGQLTDDDGDGVITDQDTPDVVIVGRAGSSSTTTAVLRVISGDGSVEHLAVRDVIAPNGTSYRPYRYQSVALGDVDADGDPEIAATVRAGSSCYAGLYDVDGTLAWVYDAGTIACRSHAPAIADLDADGAPEVIFGNRIFNGEDGTLQGLGALGKGYHSGYSNSGWHAFGVDLDGDGIQEVLAGNAVYAPDGSTVCATGSEDGYPAVANLDADDDGEFVVSGNGQVRVFDTDCSLLHEWNVYNGGNGGPATIADFDGDGDPEIAVAGSSRYSVYEVDGLRLWSATIDDSSSASTGSSVFDFDGDGAAEVVYADENDLWVFDGATGAVLLQEAAHASGTVNEYPTIADADGDGKAEILVAHNTGNQGLTVYGDLDDNWVSARTVWNQHAYSITNIDDDLSVPAVPDVNWPDYNTFRQGGFGAFDPQAATNLYVTPFGPCQDACGADVEILIQVGNDGQITAADYLDLTVYGEDAAGDLVELATLELGDPLPAGGVTTPYVFTMAAADLVDYVALVVVVDDQLESNECEELDNDAVIDLSTVCQ